MRCGKTLIPVLGGLLKFIVDLGGGGLSSLPYIFCTLHNLNKVKTHTQNISKRECF
jgi:hypothetical protein